MRRLTCLFAFLALAGMWATAVATPPLPLLQASGPAGSLADDLFLDSGQLLGNALSRGAALGDLNGNGHTDAFVANFPGPNEVWLNEGSGFFTGNGQSLGNSDSQAVALGDLNGNGYLDAVAANANGLNQVWLNDGSGHFSAGQTFEEANSRDVALGDLNGNGRLDAIFANANGNTVWFNNGDGTFSDSGQSLGQFDSFAVALADLNDNGRLDAFFANGVGGPDTVWFNDGSGLFSDSGQRLGAGWSDGVALGDLNGNGFVDAFIASSFPEPNLVWLNDGNGTFSDSLQRLAVAASNGVALADVTGDNNLDAIVANNYPDGIRVWLNNGHALFEERGQALGETLTYDVALADLDGDGDLDIFAANAGPNQVWLNQGGTPLPLDGADLEVIVLGEKYRDLSVNPGTLVNFNVTVHNHGPELATGVIVQGSHRFFDASGGECATAWCDAWLFGDLPAGQSATATYGTVFGTPANMGAIRYTATANVSVTGLEADPNPGNNHSTFTTYFFDCGSSHCTLEWIFCGVALPQSSNLFALRPLAEKIIGLAVYYLVRDGVLMGTAEGQRYVDLYYTHDPEINALLEADAELEAQAIATLQLWEPNLWALVTGRGADALITAEQVAAVDAFLTDLAAVASPDLQQVIAEERARLGPPEDYVGLTMAQARGIIVGYSVRLPLISLLS